MSLDFFDDIFIPGNRLQTNSKFDEREQLWFWEYENEEGKHPLYMELGEVHWKKPTGFWVYEIEESQHSLHVEFGVFDERTDFGSIKMRSLRGDQYQVFRCIHASL